jgi:hypothetical protein
MAAQNEARPLGAAELEIVSVLSGNDTQITSPNPVTAQDPSGSASIGSQRNPRAVLEARLGLIRDELYGDLDEIRILAERGLRALEVGNDLDLGRAFDQSVKHFRAVAANLKALVLVTTGRAP